MGCLGNEERVLGFKERVGVVGKEGSEGSHVYDFKGVGVLKHWLCEVCLWVFSPKI